MNIDGAVFPDGTCPIVANLWMFSQADEGNGFPRTPEQRYESLKAAIDLAFNCPDSICRILWNGWSERMLRAMIGDWGKKRFLGLAGCSSSTKSHTIALYGLMEYWARPADTYFLCMSTTKDAARTRIWKSVSKLWEQAERKGCPGKMIDSNGYIKGLSASGKLNRNTGIILKPAGSASDDASNELLGIKNDNVIVAADEFNHLTDGILKTAYENMTSNDRLNFVGMANPDKLTDPFGDLCEPMSGWKSITEDDEEWVTKYGRCIRFNAEKSPRIAEDALMTEEEIRNKKQSRLHFMPDLAYCNRIAENRGGKKSRGYYRFVKAFWCPDGAANSIYSEVELINSCALDQREPQWDSAPIMLSGFDPSHSRFGDRSVGVYAKLGKSNGRTHLHFCHTAVFEEDINDKTASHSLQVVRQWVELCKDFGVRPSGAAMDNTGGGTVVGHMVDDNWSPAVQKVNFNGKASERTVVFRNEDVGFYNKNSELWIQAKEFIRSNQISGITKEMMAEMVDREYHDKEGRTLRVESKEDAKKRLKRSPDIIDAAWLVVEKAVTLGLFRSEEVRKVAKMVDQGWLKARQKKGLSAVCGRRLSQG